MTVRLLGAFAHPDDDVYQLGATLAMHVHDLETTLVFASSGEAGPITDPSMATRESLGRVREEEQAAALAALGVRESTNVRFLRHPDYYLPGVPFEDLVGELLEILRTAQPHAVVTFGPDGMTSHHDHIRVGEACTEAFHRARQDAPAGTFLQLFHTALPRSAVDRFYAGLEELGGSSYGEEGTLFNLVGVPDGAIAVRVDARPFVSAKLAAILAHRTQRCEWERIPELFRWIHLDQEAFVQAWPGDGAAEPRTDLLAGL